MAENKDLLGEISKDHFLKHVDTADRSAPKIEGMNFIHNENTSFFWPPFWTEVQVKKTDRNEFLNEVNKSHDLKRAETADRSTPQIDCK